MNYKLGCVKSPKDVRNYRIAKTTRVSFPESFSLQSTTILDQGQINSCVAHATSSVLESIYKNTFSPCWIYGNRNTSYLGEGMYISDALKTATKLGGVPRKDFDLNEEMLDAYNDVNANRKRLQPIADNFKIAKYAELLSDNERKEALMRGLPLVASITVKEDYLSMKNNIINVTNDAEVGGHAIMIYGWNKDGWLIQNSWGDSWGKKGTAILPFKYGVNESYAVSQVTEDIVAPKNLWFREIIQFFVKLFRRFK